MESCVGPCGCWARLCWQGSPGLEWSGRGLCPRSISGFYKKEKLGRESETHGLDRIKVQGCGEKGWEEPGLSRRYLQNSDYMTANMCFDMLIGI